MTTELITFLRARHSEDELWATEASRRGDGPPAPGGVHWQWVDPDNDQVLEVDPGLDDLPCDPSLRSRETWPTNTGVGDLPQFAIYQTEEVPAAVAGHILRHDPARVLRDVRAARLMIEQTFRYEARNDGEWGCCHTAGEIEAGKCPDTDSDGITALRILALPYNEHPDYRKTWRHL